ncbi:1-phosphofructokinase family hexose kinase [Brachybacterium huguangmaarense]
MILVLTPNPALDVTYELDELRPGAENRVRAVRTAPGGKGVNAARVIARLGGEVTVLGPLGGTGGEELRVLLSEVSDAGRIHQAWTPIAGATRRTVAVVGQDGATGLYEPGPALSPDERDAVVGELLERAGAPDVEAVVISGSLPGGMDVEDLARLVERLRGLGVRTVVDTSGPGMLAAARAGADVIKPNRDEAIAATGADDPVVACRALLDLGARAVVCSLGADGMLLAERSEGSGGADSSDRAPRLCRAGAGREIRGNATGAGDSVVAELALALAEGRSLRDALPRAVATSASAVARPVAGEIDEDLRAELLPAIEVRAVNAPGGTDTPDSSPETQES